MNFDFDIDLDNMYPPVWFGDKPGKKVYLRLCPPEKIEEFRKIATKTEKKAVLNPESRRMELVDDVIFDAERFNTLLHDYCIKEWDIVDVKGKKIDCTEENKIRLMKMLKFFNFINECFKELNIQAGLQREEERKNSESTQDES